MPQESCDTDLHFVFAEPIGQMSRYLETLEFEAEPDYQLLRQLLGSLSQLACDAAATEAAAAAAFQAQADFDVSIILSPLPDAPAPCMQLSAHMNSLVGGLSLPPADLAFSAA